MNTFSSRGYALVTVLWLVTLLAATTASFHTAARVEARALAQATFRARAEAAAEAGVWMALREIVHTDAPIDSARTMSYTLDAVEIAVVTTSEAGKVNLNRARSELLERILSGAGAPPDRVSGLASAILDWRDADSDRRPEGSEDSDYRSAGLAHEAKDAAFATVDELRFVLGMTEDVFRATAPSVTVHGRHDGVDPAAAGADVLTAISLADDAEIERFLLARDAKEAGALALTGLERRFVERTRDSIYTARSTATLGPSTVELSATVMIQRGDRPELVVLEWDASPTLTD